MFPVAAPASVPDPPLPSAFPLPDWAKADPAIAQMMLDGYAKEYPTLPNSSTPGAFTGAERPALPPSNMDETTANLRILEFFLGGRAKPDFDPIPTDSADAPN